MRVERPAAHGCDCVCGKSNSPPCPRKERGDKDGAASLPAYMNDALFQHIHGYICFLFGHYQRGAEADCAGAAA